MALRIDIKAGERFVLNNTLMSLTRSSGLILENRATFMRQSDMLPAVEADTAARQIYFFCQELYLREDRFDLYYPRIKTACMQLAASQPWLGPQILNLGALLAKADLYRALKLARDLMKLEAGALELAEPSVRHGISGLDASVGERENRLTGH